jgi:hypothetical protein
MRVGHFKPANFPAWDLHIDRAQRRPGQKHAGEDRRVSLASRIVSVIKRLPSWLKTLGQLAVRLVGSARLKDLGRIADSTWNSSQRRYAVGAFGRLTMIRIASGWPSMRSHHLTSDPSHGLLGLLLATMRFPTGSPLFSSLLDKLRPRR